MLQRECLFVKSVPTNIFDTIWQTVGNICHAVIQSLAVRRRDMSSAAELAPKARDSRTRSPSSTSTNEPGITGRARRRSGACQYLCRMEKNVLPNQVRRNGNMIVCVHNPVSMYIGFVCVWCSRF